MFCLLVVAAAIAAFISVILLAIIFVRCDGDFVLMFAEKFGRSPESLAGKVVWITGASSGIGEHMAYCLAKAGCKLVLSARREEQLIRVKKRCLEICNRKLSEDDVMVLPLNVVAFETHKMAVQKVLENFNKVDILVNNAGRSQRSPWLEVDLRVDHELFDTNVLGPVSLTTETLSHMVQRKQGHIVVMSSLAGKHGAPNSRSYTGSKHAVHGYFECLRTEMGEHNIDVTLLCPGPVFSNFYTEAATGKPGEKIGKPLSPKDKRMSTERCAYLSCVAIANRLYEAWITQQPFLIMSYINQYFPDLARWLAKKIGLKMMMKIREGH